MENWEYLPNILGIENFEHKLFVPLNNLEETFTYKRIYSLIKQYIEFYYINKIVNRVLNKDIRIFTVLAAV